MKRKILNIAAVLLFAGSLQAQQLDSYITDIFNFSSLGLDGTASYVGRAGAIGALGGDFTAGSYNPAGLGLFYSSQISITPSVNWASNNNTYMGLNGTSDRTTFNLSDLAVLLAIPTNKSDDWQVWQFGIGFNKLKNFNNKIYAEGDWTRTSIVDSWVNAANVNPSALDNFSTALAYDTWLIDTVIGSGGNTLFNNFAGHTNQLYQTEQITESGWLNEMTFSLSGNYNDRFYIGGTIGIPFLSYRNTEIYRETATTDEYFDYTSYRDMTGAGVNMKIGAIYRPAEFLRIGFAFHTPTWYSIEEVYASSILNSTSTHEYYSESGEVADEFWFRSPLKLIGSLALTFGNMNSPVAGSIDFDYEFTNYGGMAFTTANEGLTNDLYYETWKNNLNQTIEANYRAAHTFRIGGTLNIKKFAVRAGFAHNTNPYKEATELDASSTMYSAGLGYQNKHYFIDFAYARVMQKDKFTLIDPNEVLSVNRDNNIFVLTMGLKF